MSLTNFHSNLLEVLPICFIFKNSYWAMSGEPVWLPFKSIFKGKRGVWRVVYSELKFWVKHFHCLLIHSVQLFSEHYRAYWRSKVGVQLDERHWHLQSFFWDRVKIEKFQGRKTKIIKERLWINLLT